MKTTADTTNANEQWGDRDKQGEWKPESSPSLSPLFSGPFRLRRILTYLFGFEGFLWPFNAIYAGVAILAWYFLTPPMEVMETFQVGWIAQVFLRNAALLALLAGGLHFRLYVKKAQGQKYKYSDKWLAENDKKFLFKNQLWDNVFWSLGSGVFFWTAWEVVSLWLFANGSIPFLRYQENPVLFIGLMVLIPMFRSFHFYWIHRLIHWRPLYRFCHYLHHKNINVGPWTGLAMHPFEHLLYFSGALLHWIIPSHPIHMIFHLQHAALSPVISHAGFFKILTDDDEKGVTSDHYFHYLHHRYFSVNFGSEALPLDAWFGSYHDGTKERHQQIMEKRRERARRKNAKQQ